MNRYVELPRNKIKFYGKTEKERKANELIFDLSLENSALHDELQAVRKGLIKTKLRRDKYKNRYLKTNRKLKEIQNELNEKNKKLTLTVSLDNDQLAMINNRIDEIKKEYESKINNTIEYVKDCLEHLCTVDEIEILNKLGYNSNDSE